MWVLQFDLGQRIGFNIFSNSEHFHRIASQGCTERVHGHYVADFLLGLALSGGVPDLAQVEVLVQLSVRVGRAVGKKDRVILISESVLPGERVVVLRGSRHIERGGLCVGERASGHFQKPTMSLRQSLIVIPKVAHVLPVAMPVFPVLQVGLSREHKRSHA